MNVEVLALEVDESIEEVYFILLNQLIITNKACLGLQSADILLYFNFIRLCERFYSRSERD